MLTTSVSKSLKRSNSASYAGNCAEHTPLNANGTNARTTFFLPRKSLKCQIRRQLRRAHTAKRERHKRQNHILLAAQIAQMPIFAISRLQRKIWGDIAHFQSLRLCTIECIHSQNPSLKLA